MMATQTSKMEARQGTGS